jgi:hypothetical protein
MSTASKSTQELQITPLRHSRQGPAFFPIPLTTPNQGHPSPLDKGRGVALVGVVRGMGRPAGEEGWINFGFVAGWKFPRRPQRARQLNSGCEVMLLDLLDGMAARRGAQVPAHRPVDQRLGSCPAQSVRSLPSWPGIQAVRRNLDLSLSQLHDASRDAPPKYYKGFRDAQGW